MADDETPSQTQESSTAREFSANGTSMSTTDVEAKLDKGNIEEAESSLRERLSLNSEEARTLLGRLEYQRGNVEAALRVLDGIDLQAAIQKLQPSSQQAARLVLEGVYLKVKSLQKRSSPFKSSENLLRLLRIVQIFLMLWGGYFLKEYLMPKLRVNCRR